MTMAKYGTTAWGLWLNTRAARGLTLMRRIPGHHLLNKINPQGTVRKKDKCYREKQWAPDEWFTRNQIFSVEFTTPCTKKQPGVWLHAGPGLNALALYSPVLGPQICLAVRFIASWGLTMGTPGSGYLLWNPREQKRRWPNGGLMLGQSNIRPTLGGRLSLGRILFLAVICGQLLDGVRPVGEAVSLYTNSVCFFTIPAAPCIT